MKINTFLHSRAFTLINELLEGPVTGGQVLFMYVQNMFSHFLNDEDIELGY